MNLDKADADAIRIMYDAHRVISASNTFDPPTAQYAGLETLEHAIRHLAYPDRAVYPKRRGQRKTERRRVAG